MVPVQSPGVQPSSEKLNGLYYCWKPGAPLRNLQVVFEARMHGRYCFVHKSFVRASHRLLDNFDQPCFCDGSTDELVRSKRSSGAMRSRISTSQPFVDAAEIAESSNNTAPSLLQHFAAQLFFSASEMSTFDHTSSQSACA
jgi:hypothetical protein